MKHLMTLALAAVTLISVQAADSVFRSDINCVKTQNPLEIKSDNMKTETDLAQKQSGSSIYGDRHQKCRR